MVSTLSPYGNSVRQKACSAWRNEAPALKSILKRGVSALPVDRDHAVILRSGSAKWNAWRDKNATTVPDLVGFALKPSERQLTAPRGRPLNLRSARLHGAMFRFAALSGVDLEAAELLGIDLAHARLDHANLFRADLSAASLDHADLTAANLMKTNLAGSRLRFTCLSAARLSAANLSGADLTYAKFNDADLKGADLSYAVLDYADFQGASLSGVNLRGANLYHARNLTRAQLEGSLGANSSLLPPSLQSLEDRLRILRTTPKSFARLDQAEWLPEFRQDRSSRTFIFLTAAALTVAGVSLAVLDVDLPLFGDAAQPEQGQEPTSDPPVTPVIPTRKASPDQLAPQEPAASASVAPVPNVGAGAAASEANQSARREHPSAAEETSSLLQVQKNRSEPAEDTKDRPRAAISDANQPALAATTEVATPAATELPDTSEHAVPVIVPFGHAEVAALDPNAHFDVASADGGEAALAASQSNGPAIHADSDGSLTQQASTHANLEAPENAPLAHADGALDVASVAPKHALDFGDGAPPDPIRVAALSDTNVRLGAEGSAKEESNAAAATTTPGRDPGLLATAENEPLLLVVSLRDQHIDIFRGADLVTSAKISSGKRGYDTRTGVFSILEKKRYHHSNLYSGAPMPWMQRLTRSGTALHAGVIPGYPASHGCIRLPYSFAPKLFAMTKVGGNVVVASDRITPKPIQHANLFQPESRPTPLLVASIGSADISGAIGAVPIEIAALASGMMHATDALVGANSHALDSAGTAYAEAVGSKSQPCGGARDRRSAAHPRDPANRARQAHRGSEPSCFARLSQTAKVHRQDGSCHDHGDTGVSEGERHARNRGLHQRPRPDAVRGGGKTRAARRQVIRQAEFSRVVCRPHPNS